MKDMDHHTNEYRKAKICFKALKITECTEWIYLNEPEFFGDSIPEVGVERGREPPSV